MELAGKFIVFEGIDGSGKSTQLSILAKKIEKNLGVVPLLTREPSDGPIGVLLRQMLTGRIKADYRVIAKLFATDRLDHLTNETDGILSQLQAGRTVLCDRYYFSSYAYHSGDMPMEEVMLENRLAEYLLPPTVTVYLAVNPQLALERIGLRGQQGELFESETRLVGTLRQYEKAFSLRPEEKVLRIDANRSMEKVAEDVWEGLSAFFSQGNQE